MHELGHSLGLRHGGFENDPNKPNHYSTMNYAYESPGLLDYSDGSRAPLDAYELVEGSVLLDSEEWILPVVYDCWDKSDQTGVSNQPIDWTCDGSLADACTQEAPCRLVDDRFTTYRDNDGVERTVERYTRSLDFDDWSNLDFRGGVTGLQLREFPLMEMPPEDGSAARVVIDVKPGFFTNPVNIKSRGLLAVGIFGTPAFRPATLLHSSILLAESQSGPSIPAERCDLADFNEDALDDLLCKFRTERLGLDSSTKQLHADSRSSGR
jgi:hypothetical protein